MITDKTNLSKDDFNDINLNYLFNEIDEETCYQINRIIKNKIENITNDKKKEIYMLLGAITFLKLNKEIGGDPFIRDLMFVNSRKIRIDDIDDSYFVFLKDIIDEINSNELKARIADLLWIKRNDYIMAKKSIDYYLKSAESLENDENWVNCFERINRATNIAVTPIC